MIPLPPISTIAICLLLLTNFPSHAQQILPLWPAGQIPNAKASAEPELYDTSDVVHVGRVKRPDIAVYLPPGRVATGQAVVVCPGGGYVRLAYTWEGVEIAKWLNSHGIAAIVLKYRLPEPGSNVTPRLSPLLDAQRAIRLVRHHAKAWNIDPDKVGVMGFSAGGHLASTLGTHFDAQDAPPRDSIDRLSARPDFMILMYPVITMSEGYMHSGSRNRLIGENPPADLATYYSTDTQVTARTPPTILFHAGDDQAVPVENSLSFYRALVKHGVPAELHVYPTGGHGFGLAIGKGHLETWPDRCVEWLRSLDRD